MKKTIFPYEAKLNMVISIVRILHNRKGKISIKELIKISNLNHAAIYPLIIAGNDLGLFEIKENYIHLTKIGAEFYMRKSKGMDEIRERLKRYEPFKSSFELAERNGYFSIDELEEDLNKSGMMLHSNLTKSKALLTGVLVQWAIFFGLLNYDSVKRLWIKTR